MLNGVTLVIGYCNKQILADAQQSVVDKLTSSDETAVRYRPLTNDFKVGEEINQLLNNVKSDNPVDKQKLNLIVYFDGKPEQAGELSFLLKEAKKTCDRIGVWTLVTHLVWLIKEQKSFAQDYRSMIDRIPYGADGFTCIYLLSDKNSKLSSCSNEQMEGAGLLLNMLLYTQPRSGVYTIGVGKLNISIREMCEYVCHQACAAIRNRNLNHADIPSTRDMCAYAFEPGYLEEAKLPGYLVDRMRAYVGSTFCYVVGETDIVSEVQTPGGIDYEADILNGWRQNILRVISQNPFVEDALSFFDKNGPFNEFVDQMETQAHIDNKAEKCKPAHLGIKKTLGQQYNFYAEQRKVRCDECIREFCKRWKMAGSLLVEELQKYRDIRDQQWTAGYRKDEAYLTLCENTAREVTDQLNRDLAGLRFTKAQCDSHYYIGSEEECQTAWDKLMNWVIRETHAGEKNKALIQAFANKSSGDLINDVLKPIDKQTKVYLAALRHDRYGEPDQKMLFIPESMPTDDSLSRAIPGYDINRVQDLEYKNIEAIALMRLGNDLRDIRDELTAFVAMEDEVEHHHFITLESEEPETVKHPVCPEVPPEQIQEEVEQNLWQMEVNCVKDNYKLSFDWKNPEIDSIKYVVRSQERGNQTGFVKKNDFMNAGYVDFDAQVGYGPHTVDLFAAGEKVSTCSFPGRMHQVYLSITRGELTLDGNISIVEYEITVDTVDKNANSPLDDQVCRSLTLQLNGRDTVRMPMPKIKKRRQNWIVYTESDNLILVPGQDFDDFYEIHS